MADHTFARTPTVPDLPEDLLREIGRYIVGFARLEWILSRFAYAILRLDGADGRIAVREPRATERVDMICDLLDNRFVASKADVKALRKDIGDCEEWRNLLAHSTWVVDPLMHALRLVKTGGQWQPTRNHPPKTKRRVAPEAIPLGANDVVVLNAKLQSVLEAVDQWAREFLPPEASQ